MSEAGLEPATSHFWVALHSELYPDEFCRRNSSIQNYDLPFIREHSTILSYSDVSQRSRSLWVWRVGEIGHLSKITMPWSCFSEQVSPYMVSLLAYDGRTGSGPTLDSMPYTAGICSLSHLIYILLSFLLFLISYFCSYAYAFL